MTIKPDRLTVRLNWHGRVLDGPLKKRVKAGDACWSIDVTHVDIGRIKANSLRLKKAQQAAASVGATRAGSQADGSDKGRENTSVGSSSSSSGGNSSRAAVASELCVAELSGPGESEMSELLVILPKEEEGRYWRALFEGGEEKSHIQVRILTFRNAAQACTSQSLELGSHLATKGGGL